MVLILADDLGFSDLGCFGGEIHTPNLDRLAARGMRFTQFYNCAVCVTTRAALMTGLYPRPKEQFAQLPTIGDMLRSAGYQTALVGKWHLGGTAGLLPTDRGFDLYFGLASGCCNYFDPSRPDPAFYGGARRPFFRQDQRVTEFPPDFYMTDALTDEAIANIRGFAGKESPFFLHVCYTAPHFPLHARSEDVARYRGQYRHGYFRLREERLARQRRLGIVDDAWRLPPADQPRGGGKEYDYRITPWEEVEDKAREEQRMEVYAAMVDRLDQGVGRILVALDEAQVAENTLVIFLSDNGGCASFPPYDDRDVRGQFTQYNRQPPGGVETYDFCGPGWGWAQCAPFRRYKTWTYEGGIATPMIACWPATIAAGSLSTEVGHVIDFMPTFAALSGTEPPRSHRGRDVPASEGTSLVATLRNGSTPLHASVKRREPLCWSLDGNRAVRDGRWKLVWGRVRRRWELYDMEGDRTETTDLADEFPDRVAKLSEAWRAWAERTGAGDGD